MDDTDSRAIGKESRAERRIKRFDQAKTIWNVLEKNGLMKTAIEKIYRAKDEIDIKVSLQNLLEEIRNKDHTANVLFELRP